ncbi:MAG: LysR family transcriptional regulator [Alphaproteobacteria bacterium]|nr:MAG: LysR family transcriptional regulator [Alphaproteobacteria bacterium]
MRPTAAGELVIAEARSQRQRLDRLASDLDALAGLRRGHVTIAAVEAVAESLLPEAILAFRARHAGVGFSTVILPAEQAAAAVADDRAEVGLVFNPPARAELQVLAARDEPLCALVAPNHPLASRASVRLVECLAYPLALPDRTSGVRPLMEAFLAGASQRLEPAIESSSFAVLIAFARSGQGVAFQILPGVAHAVADGAVLAIPLSDPALFRGRLEVLTRRGRALPLAAAEFATLLGDQVLNG